MNRLHRILGFALLAGSFALLATLAYEPAHLATLPGLDRLSEAVVVVAGLALVAIGTLAGIAKLRSQPAQ